MAVSLTAAADLLRPGIAEMSRGPEYQAAKRVLAAIDAEERAAPEVARYNALSATEKEKYDALTRATMPRLASDEELARRQKERDEGLRRDVQIVVDWATERFRYLDL